MFVKIWMQQDIISVSSNTTIAEADRLLQDHPFRHLPVVEHGELLGIISGTDITRAMPSTIDASLSPEDKMMLSQAKVSMFMTESPVTTTPLASLESVALQMSTHKIGAVPVLENNTLVGIITESDILRAFAEILSGDSHGARIEIQIGHDSLELYTMIDICKQHKMSLTAITVYRDFSPDQQLITLRVSGERIDEMVDALWDSGIKVNQVVMDGS